MFLFYFERYPVKHLFCGQTVNTSKTSHSCPVLPAYICRFAFAAVSLLPPLADQRRNGGEISFCLSYRQWGAIFPPWKHNAFIWGVHQCDIKIRYRPRCWQNSWMGDQKNEQINGLIHFFSLRHSSAACVSHAGRAQVVVWPTFY